MLAGTHRLKQHDLAASAGQPAETIGAGWGTASHAEPALLPSATPAALPGLDTHADEEDDTVLIGSTAPSFSQPPTRPEQLAGMMSQLEQHPQAPHQQPQLAEANAVKEEQLCQQVQHSRQQSLVGHALGADDLSLAELAGASRRGTRRRSTASMASTRGSCGTGDAVPETDGGDLQQVGAVQRMQPEQQPQPVACHEQDELLAAAWAHKSHEQHPPQLRTQQEQQQEQWQHQQRQQHAARLSSEELAVLRQSLADLQVDPGTFGGSPDASGCADIPDQLVLQALSSRLGRLDSQKRRVLLEVLAKIDGLGQGDGTNGPDSRRGSSGGQASRSEAALGQVGRASTAAGQLMSQSLHSSQRASTTEGAGPAPAFGPSKVAPPTVGAASSVAPEDEAAQGAAQLVSQPAGDGSQTRKAEPQLEGGAVGAAAAVTAAPDLHDGSHSPSKALAGKLAALRSRSGSFAGRQHSGPGEACSGASSPLPASLQDACCLMLTPAAQAAGRAAASEALPGVLHQLSQQPQQPKPPAQQPVVPAVHAALVSGRLQPMVQQRHRERSRLLVDGLRGTGRQPRLSRPPPNRSKLSPAASVSGPATGDALSTFAAEHQGQAQAEAHAAASPPAAPLISSMISHPRTDSGFADSLQLLGQPVDPSFVPNLAASPSPLSARGQLPRTATLPVLPQAGPSRGGNLQAGTAAPAAYKAAHHAPAAAKLAACRQGSIGVSTAGASTGPGPAALLHSRELTMVLLDTWGDSHFVGLSGLQLLGPCGQPLPLGADQLAADPPDLNCFPGHSGASGRTACLVLGPQPGPAEALHFDSALLTRRRRQALCEACSAGSASACRRRADS